MEYPPNSRKSKLGQDDQAAPTEKKIEKVVETEIVRRKKPLSKRFAEIFFGGDTKGVVGYVVMDVLLPAAKDTVADAVSQGIERMLFGESRSTSRRTGRPGGGGYTSYNRISSNRSDPRREERPQLSQRARASHDFEEIIIATRVEAEEVLSRMFDILTKYETVTVSDLYELLGITPNYTDEKYGWTDLRGAGVTRVRNGYLLDLAKPELLD